VKDICKTRNNCSKLFELTKEDKSIEVMNSSQMKSCQEPKFDNRRFDNPGSYRRFVRHLLALGAGTAQGIRIHPEHSHLHDVHPVRDDKSLMSIRWRFSGPDRTTSPACF
jgi:hypothetical protein